MMHYKDEYVAVTQLFFSKKEPPISFSNFEREWTTCLEVNTDKYAIGDDNTPTVQLNKMYIMEYYCFALSVGDASQHCQLQFMLRSLFISIANTSFAIYKLAFDGFNYQAEVLIRNLYELCMTLLNVVIDQEKRKELMNSASNGKEYEVWKKHFKPSRLRESLLKYESSLGEAFSDDWHKRVYSKLSSYAHNDYFNFLTGSFSTPKSEDDMMMLNICGCFADRTEHLLEEVNAILYYTGMVFMKALVDEKIDLTKEQICLSDNDSSKNQTYWDEAAFWEMWNRECYIKTLEETDLSVMDSSS